MFVPELLLQATGSWARMYADSHTVSTGVTYLHFAGLLLAGGAAVSADRATLLAAREDKAGRLAYLPRLAAVHGLVIGGLGLMMVSGVLMFLADLETFWGLRVFWIKMGLVALLLTNGLIMRRAERLAASSSAGAWIALKATSVISVGLWFVIILASTILAGS
jgi:hypothetical protein